MHAFLSRNVNKVLYSFVAKERNRISQFTLDSWPYGRVTHSPLSLLLAALELGSNNLTSFPGKRRHTAWMMADTGTRKCLPEWKALFQKSLGKLSGKCYRSFLLDLAAIYLGLKPSLLFDYAVVDSTNASILMAALSTSEGLVPYSLDVLKVGEDIFFTDLANMVSHLKKSVEYEEFTLVDVSGKLQEPRVLQTDSSMCVKKQFAKIVEVLEQKLKRVSTDLTQRNGTFGKSEVLDLNDISGNDENWCIPCVFGFLLGYPVIYWCDQASECNCLNLVPLNRYTVTVKESSLMFHSKMLHSSSSLFGVERVESCDGHSVFSFTAPVELEPHYESNVSRWLKSICDMGQTLGISEHLTVKKEQVSFAQVTL